MDMKAAIPVSLLVLLAGCATPAAAGQTKPAGAGGVPASVPVEFRAACGHPGALVTVKQAPVTVAHADCDLTGVTIAYGLAQVAVPKPGETASTVVDTFAETDQPTQIEVGVDATTLDVTVTGK